MTSESPLPVLAVRGSAACCVALDAGDLSPDDAQATAALFKALGDPARVRLVNILATSGDPVCVCDLTAQLELSQPTVSHHLKKLLTAGLVERERRGLWAYYSINPDAMVRLAAVVAFDGGRR
jgi:ArsR family transcriptional regulator, arsenate/arsenite/antimonite-responsive transcriptional repressor